MQQQQRIITGRPRIKSRPGCLRRRPRRHRRGGSHRSLFAGMSFTLRVRVTFHRV